MSSVCVRAIQPASQQPLSAGSSNSSQQTAWRSSKLELVCHSPATKQQQHVGPASTAQLCRTTYQLTYHIARTSQPHSSFDCITRQLASSDDRLTAAGVPHRVAAACVSHVAVLCLPNLLGSWCGVRLGGWVAERCHSSDGRMLRWVDAGGASAAVLTAALSARGDVCVLPPSVGVDAAE